MHSSCLEVHLNEMIGQRYLFYFIQLLSKRGNKNTPISVCK